MTSDGKCLSYGGGDSASELGYSWQNTHIGLRASPLPASVIKNIRSLAYQFIWDGRKGILCSHMILARSEEGLEVKDLPIITRSANVKRAARFRNEDQSILT